MRVFPASTNHLYRGPGWVIAVMYVLSVLTIGPALVHMFKADGGAFAIAGLDPAAGRDVIIGIFAWAGASQFVWGLAMLGVTHRYRDFVPAILGLGMMEQSLISLNAWVLKPGHGLHHPPGTIIALVAVPLLAGLLAASTRNADK